MIRIACCFFLVLLVVAASAAEPPPSGVQVWNCEPWQTVSAGDFSGANPKMKALKPVELLGTRNGVCSGFVVVTRDGGAIKGLKASAGELAQAGGGKGRIPAARVQVRFSDRARPEKSWMPPQRFDRLLGSAPAEVPAGNPGEVKGFQRKFAPKTTAAVATVPVWVTVRVPADAAAGDYEGTLSVEAEGLAGAPAKVPVRLKVHDWQLPEPKDFRVRTLGWINPEALAKHYNAELWSDRHFELMGRSMEMMLELGSRHLIVNVTKGYPAQDNADTMVKWVKQADGSFKYDFTLFDRYCDLAARKLGQPFPVRLNMWRGPRNGGGGEVDDYPNTKVLVLDPATNQVSELEGPARLGSEEMKAFWKPVMDEIRARLEKRGWFDAAGPNWMCYCGGMTPQLASMVKSIWPDSKWLDMTHSRVTRYQTTDKSVYVPVFVQSTVWGEGGLDAYAKWKSGPYPRNYAGKFDPSTAWCSHARIQYHEAGWPDLWTLRTKHEEVVLKGNDGVDALGADMFPAKDAKGRYRPGEWSAFAQGPGNATLAILGAGDAGPVGTERFEAMREGVQLCEAMIFIQKALEAKKLGGELEAKANKVLDDRARAMAGCLKPTGYKGGVYVDLADYAKGARERDDALYATAAEVARAVAGK